MRTPTPTGPPGPDVRARAEDLRSGRTPFVMATVVRVERPASAHTGDRALILPDGTLEGFVGGTCAESSVRLQGMRLLETGESTLLCIQPGDEADAGPEPGRITMANPCLSGGTVEIFLEAVLPPPLVHVFGDTPVARAMAALGAAMGHEVTVSVDPGAPIAPDTAAVVVASHGRDEEAVIRAALAADVPYVGLVASPRRGAGVLAGLELCASRASRVHTPAGLDIGARFPAEIALSVFAQLVRDRPRAAPRPVGPGAAPAEALDPICHMSVAITPEAISVESDGTRWYFCGPGCRDAFTASGRH